MVHQNLTMHYGLTNLSPQNGSPQNVYSKWCTKTCPCNTV
jgi:hypothetical protein